MCKYCKVIDVFSDLEMGHGIESVTSRSTFSHVSRDPKTGKYYMDVDGIYAARFEIKNCPMCGRRLGQEDVYDIVLKETGFDGMKKDETMDVLSRLKYSEWYSFEVGTKNTTFVGFATGDAANALSFHFDDTKFVKFIYSIADEADGSVHDFNGLSVLLLKK